MSPDSNDNPTFKDLFEVQSKMQEKLDKNTDRLSRMEKGFIALTIMVASPKVGGPDAAKLIAHVLGVPV